MKKKHNILSLTFIFLISFTLHLSALNYSTSKNFLNYNLIYASGKIRYGDLYKLQREYSRINNNKQTILVFNSAGGELNEGLRIGEFLRANHIGSAVNRNGICASSCALAFLGGRDKYNRKLMILPKNSKLGFHSFYYRNSNQVKLSTMQKDLASVLSYADYVQAPRQIITEMFQTKYTSMHWTTRRDRRLLRIRRGLPTVNFIASNSNKSRYYKRNAPTYRQKVARNQKQYGITQVEYVKRYINKVNSVLNANNGVVFNNEVALNDSSYQGWLSTSLKHIYVRKTKLISINKVEAEIVYSLRNGKTVCSRNTYNLIQNSNGWKIATKQHRACNYSSKRVLNRIGRSLP